MKKKIIIIISSVVGALVIGFIALFIIINVLSNNDLKKRKNAEIIYGDFKYAKYEDGQKLAYLVGLSDEGKKKATIVVPFQIDGYIIVGFSNYYDYDCDFTTAKNIYLGAVEYQCSLMKIGKDTTIYGGDYGLYKKVLKTNSKQYVSESEYNQITKNYSNHDNVFHASVVFDFEYEDISYSYVSSEKDGLITYSPEFDTSNLNYRLEGWYNGETRWNLATDLVTENIVLNARWR